MAQTEQTTCKSTGGKIIATKAAAGVMKPQQPGTITAFYFIIT